MESAPFTDARIIGVAMAIVGHVRKVDLPADERDAAFRIAEQILWVDEKRRTRDWLRPTGDEQE